MDTSIPLAFGAHGKDPTDMRQDPEKTLAKKRHAPHPLIIENVRENGSFAIHSFCSKRRKKSKEKAVQNYALAGRTPLDDRQI